MATIRRNTKQHKAILESASGCVVYSEHNQYQGKKCEVSAAAMALHKFDFAKLVEEPGPKYVVRVHERCWFELVHGEALPSEDEGYNCSWCDVDNLSGATKCAGCGEPRGSHPADPERRPAMKIRKSLNGKLHISGGLSAANCSSGNRGMRFEGRAPAKAAISYPRDYFCKKCFGSDPYATITRMVKAGYLE